ncbi:MAG: hypothetical protein BWY76_01433 [bacterium ADurb.Bin429]|nr:MAG: hypothetical protein BWY76_01433 [bacterium ADurb.Bin429]
MGGESGVFVRHFHGHHFNDAFFHHLLYDRGDIGGIHLAELHHLLESAGTVNHLQHLFGFLWDVAHLRFRAGQEAGHLFELRGIAQRVGGGGGVIQALGAFQDEGVGAHLHGAFQHGQHLQALEDEVAVIGGNHLEDHFVRRGAAESARLDVPDLAVLEDDHRPAAINRHFQASGFLCFVHELQQLHESDIFKGTLDSHNLVRAPSARRIPRRRSAFSRKTKGATQSPPREPTRGRCRPPCQEWVRMARVLLYARSRMCTIASAVTFACRRTNGALAL